ncbi:tripartite motif-containing protein 43C-like isoform X2 [Arvicanthis niloticus]|uniref:tripartite motif-containing protein 43C-like isoform X2 n=1 Tax=Arvicanthis niloticus TaxID=61156 RepID=UPI0014871DE6|nr:tripartite motif-containing protein 43C-like [Arvicanthis niloticus]
MESDILQASQKILKCFICLGIFTDPVLLRCGHTFCRACLFLISENIQIPAYCPMCRQPSQWEFRTDITMKKLVSIVKKERFMKYLSSEEHKCVTHKERKMIFCDENRVLLCQLCSDSQEHRGHRHCPTEVAIGEQMEKILKQMESLRKKIQEQQENLEAERRMATKWVGYVTVREQMIRMAYRKLHPALDEEENQHIKCMKNEGNTILEELRKSEAMMAHKKSQLIEAYQELMTMSQKPYEVLLLQDLDDMFRRSELVQLGMPQRMKPKLSAHPNTGLTARFNFFQVRIFFQNLIIFNCKMSRFFDIRRFSFKSHHQNTSLDSVGYYRASWGAKSFRTGKHYWELDLKDYENWAVGVCNNAWLRRRNQEIGLDGAFLLVCLKEGDRYSLLTTCPVFYHYIEKPTGRVGVFLDCEGGCVSFLDVAKSSLIYSYYLGTSHCIFRPFFSTVYT